MSSENLFRTIETSVRPARVAILLDANDEHWMHTCLRVIEWSTSVWGGWYSCLIPTDGDSISEQFWKVLEQFDPDYIYEYQKSGLDIKLAEPEQFQSMVEKEVIKYAEKYPDDDASNNMKIPIERAFERYGLDEFKVSDALYTQLARRINPFQYCKEFTVLPITSRPEKQSYPITDISVVTSSLFETLPVTLVEVEASTLIQLMVYAQTGKTWPKLIERMQKANVHFEVETHTVKTLPNLMNTLWNGTNHVSTLSLINLGLYSPIGRNPKYADTVVIAGDTLADFCLYYAGSRMRGRTYWFPKSLIDLFDDQERINKQEKTNAPDEASLYLHFINFLARSAGSRKAILTSCSLSDDNLQSLAQTMTSQADTTVEVESQIERTKPILYMQRLYDRDNVGKRYRDQFYNGQSVNFVNTPTPKNLKQVPPFDLHWITDVKVENYQLPPMPEFGPSTLICPPYDTGETRATCDGFSYFCPHIAYFGGDLDTILIKPRIQILEQTNIFERLFSQAGHHIQASDKGNYHLESLKKFGTLADLAELWRNESIRLLLDRYTNKGESAKEMGCKIGDRRYLNFPAFEAVVSSVEHLPESSVETATELIERLILSGVLHRGFIFKCNACRQLDWYAVAEVTEKFVCSRCRTNQVYTKKHWIMPNEPSWYYQIDEIIYQAYSNDGHVPTLTLDLMRRSAKDSFLYLPESELLKEQGAKKQDMELDFCCCVDGMICIGEAKKANRLETKDDAEKKTLGKYRDLADRVGAKIIVLSTFSDKWSERTVENAQAIIGEKRLRFYNRSQLLTPQIA